MSEGRSNLDIAKELINKPMRVNHEIVGFNVMLVSVTPRQLHALMTMCEAVKHDNERQAIEALVEYWSAGGE